MLAPQDDAQQAAVIVRLGAERGEALLAELEALGLSIITTDHYEHLQETAIRFGRLEALVYDPSDDDPD